MWLVNSYVFADLNLTWKRQRASDACTRKPQRPKCAFQIYNYDDDMKRAARVHEYECMMRYVTFCIENGRAMDNFEFPAARLHDRLRKNKTTFIFGWNASIL